MLLHVWNLCTSAQACKMSFHTSAEDVSEEFKEQARDRFARLAGVVGAFPHLSTFPPFGSELC